LISLNDPIELSAKLLHNENILIICSKKNLFLHIYLLIYGTVICATGEVTTNEQSLKDSDKLEDDILDYTASVDDTDGRISVVFTPKGKSETIPTVFLKHPSQSINNKDKVNVDDDLLVPRLAIVILIIGTRGDVQPFIA
jgi:hypothetical protein